MNPTPLLSTHCRLCNKEIAQAAPLNIPLEGQPDWNGLQYLALLQKHLKKRHPQEAAAVESAALEFGAMLLINCYQVDDESVKARAGLIRDAFIQQFARQVSDDEITALIERTFGSPDVRINALYGERVRQMLTALRDLLTCRGEYAPKSGTLKEAPLVTVP